MAEKDKKLSSNPTLVPPPVRGVSVHTKNAMAIEPESLDADEGNITDNQSVSSTFVQDNISSDTAENTTKTVSPQTAHFIDTDAMFMNDEPISAEIDGDTPAPTAFEPDPPKDPVKYGSLKNKIEQNDRSFDENPNETAGMPDQQKSATVLEHPDAMQNSTESDKGTNINDALNKPQPPVIPAAPIISQMAEDNIENTDGFVSSSTSDTTGNENTDSINHANSPTTSSFSNDENGGTDYRTTDMHSQAADASGKISFPIERINIQPKPKDNIKSQLPAENIGKAQLLKREGAPQKTNYTSPNFLKELFSNGNECITAPGGSYVISDTTRSMLALFSNGRFFVAENHKYDGPPLLFVTDTRRRRLQIGQPEYVPQVVINNIYEYAGKMRPKTPADVEESNQEQARMQRDFVTIVSKAAANHVSDIHIVVADHTTVMFRMNGLMQTEMEYNRDWGESFVRAAFASADISDANYAQNEYQAAQKVGKTALRGSNGKLTLPRNVQGIRLQFNPIAFGTRYVVMRLLYDEDNAESAGDLSILGFEPQEVELFYRMRAIPTGMVIVAGPTGSGKSTTLQRNMISMLQERNYELNLITVEDPPEYPIPGARQMPVTNATSEEAKDREFTKALAAALRSDPDALMIGEIRTLAAADLAFRGALSGHSVWTTLHANSAPAIMMRLKDMGVEDFKLQDPSIMKGMLSQRLFRKICPYCRIRAKDRLENPAVQRLRQAYGDMGVELSYLRGPGCKHCEYRGVKGRTVVGEFLLPDATFLDLMIRGESKKAMDYWVTELNGRTLREAAQARMLKGVIDIDEVERWTGLFNDITV